MHSHTHTEAYPSPTDVAQAPDPGWHYVIVSLKREAPGAALLPHRRRRDRRGAGRAVALSPGGGPRHGIARAPRRIDASTDGARWLRIPSSRSAISESSRSVCHPGRARPVPMPIYENVLDMIGNTPLVDVSVLSPEPRRAHPRQDGEPEPVRLGEGPHRQGDDRDGREGGLLRPGQTIVEPSSGNTGIALAAIAQLKGYPIKILHARERVDRAPPDARGVRRRDHPHPGRRRARTAPCARAHRPGRAEHPEWFFPYQYANDANPRAHYEGTGPGDLARLPRDHPLRRRPRHVAAR